jgi:frataxin
VEESRVVSQPTDVTEDEYHVLADEYMEAINEKAEAMQEAREDVEVEFSVHLPHLNPLPIHPVPIC